MYSRPYSPSFSSSSRRIGFPWIPLCAEEQMSCVNPRNVNCANLTPPPTIGRPSSTRQRYPAFARYAAAIRLLCPAPATTMSNRSAIAVRFSESAFSRGHTLCRTCLSGLLHRAIKIGDGILNDLKLNGIRRIYAFLVALHEDESMLIVVVRLPLHIFSRVAEKFIVQAENVLMVIPVAALHQDWHLHGVDARHRDAHIDPPAQFFYRLALHLFCVHLHRFRRGRRMGIARLRPSRQIVNGRRLGCNAGPQTGVLRGDFHQHLAAVAEAEISHAVRIDIRQSLHELGDGDGVFVFERAAIENLAPFLFSFDEPEAITFFHLSAVSHPRHRIPGFQKLFQGPTAVLGPLADPLRAKPAVHVRKQNDGKRAIARRLSQAYRGIHAVNRFDVNQVQGNVGALDGFDDFRDGILYRLSKEDVFGINAGVRVRFLRLSGGRRHQDCEQKKRKDSLGSHRICLPNLLSTYARLFRSVSADNSFSHRDTTTVATPFPIIFTVARHMLMNRSIPRISAIPATGIVGMTVMVATRAINAAPCTPLAPFEVSTATAKIVSSCVSVSGVFVACATNSAASVMYMLVPSVLKV